MFHAVASLLGLVALPYLLLWTSRSARVRARARSVAWTGWHARLGWLGAALALVPFGIDRTGWLVVPAGLLLLGAAHVSLLVAADELRAYPDDTALHFAVAAPATWPATAWRILTTWTWLLRTRHRWLAPAFAGGGAAVVAGIAAGWPVAPLLAVGGYCLTMTVATLPVALPGGEHVATILGPHLRPPR